MGNNEQKRFILALVLSVIVLFFWQKFFSPTPAPTPAPLEKTISIQNSENKNTETYKKVETAQNESSEKTTINLKNGDYIAEVSNHLELISFDGGPAKANLREHFGKESSLQIFLNGKTIVLQDFTKSSESRAEGNDNSLGVKYSVELDAKGKLSYELIPSAPVTVQYHLYSEKKELDNKQIRDYIYYDGEVERNNVGKSSEGEGAAKWFGLDFNHNIFAHVGTGEVSTFKMLENGDMTISSVNAQETVKGYFVLTRKNYDLLKSYNVNLEQAINFGLMAVLAVPILRGLQFFYKYIPNYGVAIILITLLMRLLTFPLQYKSFKSMKKMQVLQPELKKIREKFKSEPQKLQKETMELFKKNGANPLGGCLPLLLQMPIFFALYRVIYEAVELVGSPFIFWITDLSVKDPFYVLPILMGVSFFAQQKLTPSATMDPTQQKMMMIIPLIFPFIMKDLPAGLNLYIFVSTILGIAQQMFVFKTTK